MKTKEDNKFWKKLPFDDYFVFYNKVLDSSIGKRLNLRKLSETLVYQGTKNGIKASASLGKIFRPNTSDAARLTAKSSSAVFDLNYTEEQILIQESVKEFALRLRAAAQQQDEQQYLSPEIIQAYNELQLKYFQTPESLGGIGNEKSAVTQMLILESLAYGDLGQAYALFASNSVLNALVEWGSEAQQAELIPELLKSDEMHAGIAINESEPLFSPFDLKTSAVLEADKYVLNGEKTLIPFAEKCSYFLVSAKTENNDIQLFIVNADQEGVTIKSAEAMGLKTAQLGDIELKNVKVDLSAKLGADAGINYHQFIQYAKLGCCTLAVGCCQAVLDYVINYCNERYAFGEPISNRQSVAFMIADMKIELDGMRILTQRAVAQAEQGIDFTKAAYLAHVFCSDKSMQIGTNGVQLLGGHGYIKDFPVERWYRDLRAIAILYNSIHL